MDTYRSLSNLIESKTSRTQIDPQPNQIIGRKDKIGVFVHEVDREVHSMTYSVKWTPIEASSKPRNL